MTLLSLVKAFTKLPVERLPFLLVRSVLGALLNISLDHGTFSSVTQRTSNHRD